MSPMHPKQKIIKSAGKVGLLTAVSRVFGFMRDASLAWLLGSGLGMDAFTIAFRLANLFRRLVAEGAMSAAFVPVFVQYQKEHSGKELWEFARKLFFTLALVAFIIAVLEIVLAPFLVRIMAPGFSNIGGKWELTILLTRLMAPYLLFVAMAACLAGILNARGVFAVPALNPICFNLSVIASAFFFASQFGEPAVGIACGVLIGGCLQWMIQVPAARRQGMSFRVGFSIRHPAIRKTAKLLLPSIFGIGIVQLNLLVDSLMGSLLSEGSVSQLYYADRLMELVLGIFVVSLSTVILPDMAHAAAERKTEDVKGTLEFALRMISFVTIPAIVGLFLLSDPIIHVLFERGEFDQLDTIRTAVALRYYVLGLFFISAVRIVVSAFYSLQDTKAPVQIAFVALVTNAVLNWVLMKPLLLGGIALATSLASGLSFFLLISIFQKRNGRLQWAEFNASLVKILIASVVMGGSCWFVLPLLGFSPDQSLGWKAFALFGTIGLGVVIYLGTALVLKIKEATFVLRLLKPKTGEENGS